ncbi:response regulator receiver domain [Pectobacterium versatile]|uniref:response regulator receiver domain n=1 Tax=Pectobacterium versatile TaxID=2488639 RepID=UPI001934CB04|nr:response regulator receiver domain [Pectobacterium versatile]QQK70524.1 hypothetical protein HG702_02055 [Pectobacterium versatile]
MTNFTQLSKKAADSFIQSIVFIDDKAYEDGVGNGQHDFDAKEITKIFAQNGKVCAVYEPTSVQDIDSLIPVTKKADVAVLDWQIVIDEEDEAEEDEADADIDDMRGIYTKKIITQLLHDESCKNSVKLILVYTGETDLEQIASDIHQNICDSNIQGFNLDEDDLCTIVSHSCRIMVIAKSNCEEDRGIHAELLRLKKVTYSELPVFITEQFSSLTKGLLSSFAMESLSEIRRNFTKILSQFSKNLDPAYLAHQSLLPNTHDANELLIDLLGSTFMSTLRYKGLNQYIDNNLVKSWIDENITERDFTLKKINGEDDNVSFHLNGDKLKVLIESQPDPDVKYLNVISEDINGNQIKEAKIKLLASKFAITLFTDSSDYININHRFANLCQHRSLFINDDYTPNLTLGTVVKSNKDNNYYICIQQRCDSVRLYSEESRRFLFLTLVEPENNKKFDFLTPSGVKLGVCKSTYALRTVKFNGSDTGYVQSKIQHGNRIFSPSHYSDEIPEEFEFIVELKDMYAQKIIEEYSGILSRVGLDEPEWVRRYS